MDYRTKAGMGISSWIFLKDGNRPPSQNGCLVSICVVQHVWRMLKKAGFNNHETRVEARNINLHPLENISGVITLHCGSKK